MSASPTRGSGPSVDRHTVVVAGSTLTPALDPDIFVPGAGFDPGDMQLQLYDRLMTYGTVDGGDGRVQALDRLEG